jgi:hypothetical protein
MKQNAPYYIKNLEILNDNIINNYYHILFNILKSHVTSVSLYLKVLTRTNTNHKILIEVFSALTWFIERKVTYDWGRKIKGSKEDLLRSPMVEGEKSKGQKKIS